MMSDMTEQQARALLEKVLGMSRADTCQVNIGGGNNGNIRYARNTVSTAGATSNASIAVTSSFGRRTGSATGNEFDDAALERVVRRAEELARLAPESPEWIEPLGPQTYLRTPGYHAATAGITPEFRAQVAADSILPAKGRDCVAAGFLSDSAGWNATMNSKGNFLYDRRTGVNFSLTVRTSDEQGSGYVTRDYNDVAQFNSAESANIAIEKAVASRVTRAIEPGRYTVILEPTAVSDFMGNILGGFNARTAMEGRSWLSRPGGQTRLGEKVVDERVTVYTDPMHPDVPSAPAGGDGLPRRRMTFIENGVVKALNYDRVWAQREGVEPVPNPGNLIMTGGTGSVEDLIRDTARGVLVTRFWYIRSVDPQTLLVTGLTRDGTFYIENGRIQYAIKNFRFNESPIIMLNNIDAMGTPVRQNGRLLPPIRARDFTFTSLSDAV
jgi:predicted Zn-dependent protease